MRARARTRVRMRDRARANVLGPVETSWFVRLKSWEAGDADFVAIRSNKIWLGGPTSMKFPRHGVSPDEDESRMRSRIKLKCCGPRGFRYIASPSTYDELSRPVYKEKAMNVCNFCILANFNLIFGSGLNSLNIPSKAMKI